MTLPVDRSAIQELPEFLLDLAYNHWCVAKNATGCNLRDVYTLEEWVDKGFRGFFKNAYAEGHANVIREILVSLLNPEIQMSPLPGPSSPSVGRIVHYTNLGDADGEFPPQQQAALITAVHDDWVCSLAIIYPTGMFFMQDVAFSTDYQRRHWSWPHRV